MSSGQGPGNIDEQAAGNEGVVISGNQIDQLHVHTTGPVHVDGAAPAQAQEQFLQVDGNEQIPCSTHDCTEPPVKKVKAHPCMQDEFIRCLNKPMNSFCLNNLIGKKWPYIHEFDFFVRTNQIQDSTISGKKLPEGQSTNRAVKDNIVGMNNLFTSTDRFLVLLGDTGGGKSTFVKSYGKKVLCKEIEGMEEISIVYFVDARKLTKDRTKITFFEFFFSRMLHGFDQMGEYAPEWLQDESNQRKMLIIIDGLNDLKDFAMDNAHVESIGYHDEAEPEKLFHNLLRRRLLPGVKILATSPTHAIRKYVEDVQPDRIFKLAGFTIEDSKYLFREMVGRDG